MALYYANRNTGNDSNPGTIIAPKRDLSTGGGLFSISLSPGDSCFGARDSTWPQQTMYPGTNGTSSQRITIDEYGAGSQRPTIDWQGSQPGTDTVAVAGYYSWINWRNWRIVNVGPTEGNHSGIGSRAWAAENVFANTWFNCEVDRVSEDAFFSQRISGGNVVMEGCLARRAGIRWLSTGGNFPGCYSISRAPDVSGSSGSTSVIDCVVDRASAEGINFNEQRFGTVRGGIVFAATSIGVYMDCTRDCHSERTIVYGTTDSTWHRSGYGDKVGPGTATVCEDYHGSTRGNLHGNNTRRLHMVAYCGAGAVVATGSVQVAHRFNQDHCTFVDNEHNLAVWNAGPDYTAGSSFHNNASIVYSSSTSSQTDGNNPPDGLDPDYTMWLGDTGSIASGWEGDNDTGSTFTLAKTSGWQSISSITTLGSYSITSGVLDASAQIANFVPQSLVSTVQTLTSPALDARGTAGLANPGAIKFGDEAPPDPPPDPPPGGGTREFRVERHTINFGASSDSAAVTYTTAAKNAQSVMPRITNVRFGSGGPSAGTGSQQGIATLGAWLDDFTASGCTVYRHSDGDNVDVRVQIEVWFYDGEAGGDNEWIVRHHDATTLSDTDDTETVSPSGVSNANKLVAFITGIGSAAAGGYAHFVRATRSSDDIVLDRENSEGDTVVSMAAVEFTGSNWSVQQVDHTITAWNTDETETISAVDWDHSFVVSSAYILDDEPNETTYNCWSGSTSTTVRFRQDNDSGSGSNFAQINAFVVSNAEMSVTHLAGTLDTGSNPQSESIAISPALSDLSSAGVIATATDEISGYNDDPANWLNYYLGDLDELIAWRSRSSDAALTYKAQVIDFSAMVVAGSEAGGIPSSLLLLGVG